jgi:hypothetical protein
MTAQEIVEFAKENKTFSSPEGRKIIKENSIAVLKEAIELDTIIIPMFKILNSYTANPFLSRKIVRVLPKDPL